MLIYSMSLDIIFCLNNGITRCGLKLHLKIYFFKHWKPFRSQEITSYNDFNYTHYITSWCTIHSLIKQGKITAEYVNFFLSVQYLSWQTTQICGCIEPLSIVSRPKLIALPQPTADCPLRWKNLMEISYLHFFLGYRCRYYITSTQLVLLPHITN